MPSVNLAFNILSFDVPVSLQTFYFSKKEKGRGHRIHKNIFPGDKEVAFPDLTEEEEHVYTSFSEPEEGYKPIKVDLQGTPSFTKRYYNYIIHSYFRENGILLRRSFVKDNQVWLQMSETADWTCYDRFTLRVQYQYVSQGAELLLAYDGQSRILKKSIAELEIIPPEHFGLFLHENELFNYQKLTEEDNIDLAKAYPVVNLDIIHDFNWEVEGPSKENKYKKFKEKITAFYSQHLDNSTFKSLVPIKSSGFLAVPVPSIGSVKEDSNLLLFANHHTNTDAWQGMKQGPFKKTSFTNVHFFFVFHEEDTTAAKALNGYLKDGLSYFKGLLPVTGIRFYTAPNFSIVFKDKENPLPEIQEQLAQRELKPDVQYFAIYLSPYERHEKNRQLREIYYKVKKLLLYKKIHSQVVVSEKMMAAGEAYKYSLPNIVVAILAKLNGIPWRIQTPAKDELVVGVGAFKNLDSGVRYIGSAFSFQNNGQFNEFDCFLSSDTDVLAGAIQDAVVRYASVNNNPQRLIIHFYKTMSKAEMTPILQKLHNLGLPIPVFILSINKTESSDIIAWDSDWNNLMPYSGTFVKIGKNRYLLFNNTRYETIEHKASDGYPFPVKLQLSCTQEELLEGNTVRDLIDQVYQFSRMYWKSVKQQHLPVTIKYPEMVAEIFPHFEGHDLPDFGKDKLWFL